MEMDNILPEFTPVRHKKEGYEGWIHSITRMKELFTGNTECEWQYTISVEKKEQKRVAPEEDLEVITNSRKWPPTLKKVKDPKRGFKEETKLHVLGYHLTETTPVQRWNILTNVAIPILGPLEVAKSIADLIYTRLPNQEIAERSRNSLMEWKNDLDMVLEKFKDDPEIKTSTIAQYAASINRKLSDYRISPL